MSPEKEALSAELSDAQVAFELPDRAMMQQTCLVNVNIEDTTILVPISVAANPCDINAAVLVGEFQDTGSADCTATAESMASPGSGQGGGAT